MEGSLGALCVAQRRLQSICLNPCSNGRYSRRSMVYLEQKVYPSLNPCSNGRYSRSRGNETVTVSSIRLNPCSTGRYSRRVRGVKALFQAGGE